MRSTYGTIFFFFFFDEHIAPQESSLRCTEEFLQIATMSPTAGGQSDPTIQLIPIRPSCKLGDTIGKLLPYLLLFFALTCSLTEHFSLYDEQQDYP